MRASRIALVAVLVAGLAAPASAGDLRSNIAKAVEQQAQQTGAERAPIPKAYLWPGTALFVGGMALAINGYLNNSNGKFPEFGEATSTNVKMGSIGLATAFAGGALIYLGTRSARRASPSITVGPGRLTVSKRLSW